MNDYEDKTTDYTRSLSELIETVRSLYGEAILKEIEG